MRETWRELQIPGEKDLYQHLVSVFLQTSDAFLARSRSEPSALKAVAHSWKSSAYGIGAMRLGDLCQELEKASSEEEDMALVNEIEQEYSHVRMELLASAKLSG